MNGANRPESNATRIVQFASWQHRGRSLRSPAASCFLLHFVANKRTILKYSYKMLQLYDTVETFIEVLVPLDTKEVISETFFTANLLE